MAGYFLNHSIGHYPAKSKETAASLSAFAAVWSADDDNQWPIALQARSRFIRTWEKLIGATEGSMTLAENVTVALAGAIGALPAAILRGRKVLIAEDCFPSLHFLLTGLQERLGFQLLTVRRRAGASHVEDEDFVSALSSDVALAVVTWVSSTTSKKADLASVLSKARNHGALVAVDITQGVGILDFAVGDCDFVVGSSLKWLCGYSGAGVLYVKPALLPDLQPDIRGWFSQPDPFSWALDRFEFAPDARRFDHGTPAVLAAVASQPGMDFVLKTGLPALRAHNLALTERLREAAGDLGLSLHSPANPAERGGSLMLKMADAAVAASTVSRLKQDGIYCDHRGAVLRLSPGISTTLQDVDALIAVLRQKT